MPTIRASLPLCALLLLLAACRIPDQRSAIEVRGVQTFVDEGDSNEVDEPSGVGIALISIPERLAHIPFGVEVGYQRLEDDGALGPTDQELTQDIVWAGIRAEFLSGVWRPHIGAGVLFVDGEVERITGNVSDTDDLSSPGLYVELGSRLRLTKALHIGLGVRQTFLLEDDIDGEDIEFDFLEVFVSAGFSF